MPESKPKKAKSAKRITKNMLIGDVIRKYPNTIEVLLEQGLGCIGCAVASFETIEQGANAHGINVKKLIDELNKKIKQ